MTFVVDGTNGLTFNDATTQSSTATNASNISSGTLGKARLPTGSVLQVVTALSLVSDVTSSTSYVASSLQATITPNFSTSKILVLVSGNIYGNQYVTIYRGSSDLSSTGNGFMQSNAVNLIPSSASVLDSPSTTSATTYRVYLKAISGNAYWNISTATTTITLMEISA